MTYFNIDAQKAMVYDAIVIDLGISGGGKAESLSTHRPF